MPPRANKVKCVVSQVVVSLRLTNKRQTMISKDQLTKKTLGGLIEY